MRVLIPLLLAALAWTGTGRAQVLASYADRNRVVLLFAPTADDSRLTEQLRIFAHHEAAFAERDLVFIQMLVTRGTPQTATTLRSLNHSDLSDAEQESLRHRFRVAPGDFAFVLIGKDGGEKLQSRTPVAASTLNQTIDAMPMRRDEMKHKQ